MNSNKDILDQTANEAIKRLEQIIPAVNSSDWGIELNQLVEDKTGYKQKLSELGLDPAETIQQ
ncbi:MAG TPA: hypothetical protein ENO00_07490 [Deltaproteobacteria bacterium]|nr:hypothetical protein [Deltaproteobacteria bacterium]